MSNEVLFHHGIKGQKWGIRRFQNEDGTRTAAGKKHEKTLDSYDSNKSDARLNYKQAKKDYNKAQLKAAIRTGVYQNITANQREKTKAAYKEMKETGQKLDAAKKQYKEEKKNTLADSNAKAKEIRKNMSSGEKVASFIVGGPMGSRSVANFLAAGNSTGAAYAKTFLYGNAALPMSMIAKNTAAEKSHFN